MAVFSIPESTQPQVFVKAGQRRCASVFYDGANTLYLIAESLEPSATLFTVKLDSGYPLWETPAGYSGEVRGIFSSASGGSAMVTVY